ncbi:hypothetical protein [Pseudoalteromonas denitrificans]|uniref:Peptidase M61 catalytic domain-containing protein n=1 Tax=Pseudoalteromonas denitrificans DSM 6059 TaxID=1123010 RepID=A0A1I1RFL1_9GAMM|nr:hypothetical protein [Pseudoalteromonas denitrificans]SFD33186.1 hypothetical protein SAMN02745724_04228 [Pseudoalteromonas denitrificans DSM 6059]
MHCFYVFMLFFPSILFAKIDYFVDISKDLKNIKVDICSSTVLPSLFELGRSNALFNITSLNIISKSGDRRGLNLYSNKLYIGNTKLGDCLAYQVNLNQSLKKAEKYAIKNTVFIDNRDWLFYPKNEQKVYIKFNLNNLQHQISTPFPKAKKIKNDVTFILKRNAIEYESKTVIGNIRLESLIFGNAKLELALIGLNNHKRQNEYIKWVQDMANILDQHTGLFPQRPVQILITEISSNNGPVPWAEVQRGGGASVQFYVDKNLKIETFYQDWTAVHELSHLYLPKFNTEDLWLSEGLATYYQVVLRARAGFTNDLEGWEKMLDGFERGMRDENGLNLRQTNETMHYYWGGAAYFLIVDVALRERKKTSLFDIINKFVKCCITEKGPWSAEKFTAKLDSLSGTNIFTKLLYQEALNRSFPNVNPVLEKLGIYKSYFGGVSLKNHQSYQVRQSIMSQ